MTTYGGTVKRSGKSSRLDNVHGHIFTPRSYQVELLDIALRQNTIVCLGTGTGKTFIAVMLIKELAHQVRGPKRAIYLVDTVPLIEQQAHVIEMHTDLSVGTYNGELGVDLWSGERWKEEFATHNVLVMTSQIFLDVILHGFMAMSRVHLIVFDECHHAVKHHPYAEIMKCLDSCPPDSHPRVLGLTASVLNNKCRSPAALERSLKDLESTLHSTVETASDMIMADLYGTKPEEILMECETYIDSTGLVEEIGSILAATLDFIVDFRISDDEDFVCEKDPRSGAKLVLSECLHILHELGPWCAARVAQAFAKQLAKVEEYETIDTVRRFIQLAATAMRMVQKIVDDLFDSQDLELAMDESQGPGYEASALQDWPFTSQLFAATKLYYLVTEVQTLEEFFLYMSPKVVRLIEILHEYKPDDNFTIIGDDQFSDTGSDDSDDSLHASDDDHSDDDTGTSAWSKTNNTPKNAKPSSHYVVVRRTSTGTAGENAEPIEEEGICGIVFVERKHTAFVLNKLIVELCNWDPDLYFIRSHYVTGQGVAGAVREPDSQCQKQEEVLRKFRQREINLLVSTNVLEEGVDVPKCNLVVRFSLPSTYRSYVQSKGRARAANSKYYMLDDCNVSATFKDDLRIFKGIEMVLLSHCHNHDDHSSEEITESEVDDLLPPYMPIQADGAPRVTMTSAIRLVNKYCAKLPSDVFTHLTPKSFVETKQYEDRTVYQARLQLPINSPIKEPITGVEMPSKRLAQMAAALKACEILHKSGELDDHLLPIGKELIKYEDDESEWEDHELHGQARPGTTKRKQYYYKKTSAALVGRPRPEVSCCLYALSMRLTCPITEEQNTRGRAIHKPESTSRGFGIICEQKIPKVPCFPVFTRSGEVTVSIDLVADDVCLTQAQLERLSSFHRFIFNHVLRLEKSPMMFEPDKAKASYVIVPINLDASGKTIVDWDFVTLIENSSLVPNRKRYSKDTPKEKFVFERKTFSDAVIMPSYRNIDQPQYFYVAEIRDDLNLRSPFPSPELYDTFEHYYSSKYSLEITNLEQPLLDVDHTSARLNLLTPRYMNQKGVALPTSSAETRRAKRENLQQKQILVPELCVIHPFPASLWRKAVCIPTILYRMNYLLIAEELRVQIALEAHLGLKQPLEDFQFPSLRFGFSDIDGSRYVCDLCDCNGVGRKTLADISACDYCQGKDELQQSGENGCHAVRSRNVAVNGESSKHEKKTVEMGKPHRNDSSSIHLVDGDEASTLEEIDADKDAICHSINFDNQLVNGESSKHEKKTVEMGKPHLNDSSSVHLVDGDEASTLEEIDADKDAICHSINFDNQLVNGESSKHEKKTVEMGKPRLIDSSSVHLVDGDEASTLEEIDADKAAICHSINLDNQLVNGESAMFEQFNAEDVATHPIFSSTDHLVNGEALALEELNADWLSDVRPPLNSDLSSVDDCDVVDLVADSDKNCQGLCDGHCGERLEGINRSVKVSCKDVVTSHDENITEANESSRNADDSSSVDGKRSRVRSSCRRHVRGIFSLDAGSPYGPGPCDIIQTLTMSNANDFFNLERLETIGDSFLKFAITVYLYCTYPGIHEGKLSYLRSIQVSNYNLYKLGKKKGLPECMVAVKFEPVENWLPPGYVIKSDAVHADLTVPISLSHNSTIGMDPETKVKSGRASKVDGRWSDADSNKEFLRQTSEQQRLFSQELEECTEPDEDLCPSSNKILIPYNLQTQHSLPDKSIADCVEALIGCYLVTCGQRAALLFMAWLGLRVLPANERHQKLPPETEGVPLAHSNGHKNPQGFGTLQLPPSPLLLHVPNASTILEHYLDGFDEFEKMIQYKFKDRSYLLQAFTHASYHYNLVTDCYQRLEFLGDAILDYVITRHLYEDSTKHSPGILTDLRSALVNNNIFASLAVNWNFHKYFKAVSPQLFHVIDAFVRWQREHNDDIMLDEEIEYDKMDEDIEIPKALGDIFESVAGAIYLDSGMSLETVWKVYYRMMKRHIDAFIEKIPKSPVRELLELEPETAKFEKPVRTFDGKIRVTVNVVGKGSFQGIGRNYRIAKSAAAKWALKSIKSSIHTPADYPVVYMQ